MDACNQLSGGGGGGGGGGGQMLAQEMMGCDLIWDKRCMATAGGGHYLGIIKSNVK